jgi:hypothetical protein
MADRKEPGAMSVLRLLVVLACGVAGALIATPARAAGEAATELTIRPLEPIVVGSGTDIIADLRLVGGGDPLVDEAIELSLDGEPLRRVRTALDGSIAVPMPRDLPPGEYALRASFGGRTDAYLPASDDVVLVIIPFTLEVETVPPLAGMPFALDDQRFETGQDGVARITIDVPGDHILTALDSEYVGRDQRAEFSRWNTELFGPEITIRLPLEHPLQAGFDIYRPASQVFLDLDGGAVETDRITSMTLRSSLGNVFTFPDGRERDFKSSRAVRRPNGLESVDVRYNVESVEVDGSNVVNAGQQRFLVEQSGSPWEITLLLYSATILSRDALFGFTAGTAVEVLYPDGKEEIVEADANGNLAVRWLARGIYRMRVADAPGWGPAIPVALSRDQQVELRVVTYLDMALALLTAITVAVGLLHRGRPHLIPGVMKTALRGFRVLRPLTARLRPRVAMRRVRRAGRSDPAAIAPVPESRLMAVTSLATVATATTVVSEPIVAAPDPLAISDASQRTGSAEPDLVAASVVTQLPLEFATNAPATKPRATKPRATKPKATKPRATKPRATKPKATKPRATKPRATKPRATKAPAKSASDSPPGSARRVAPGAANGRRSNRTASARIEEAPDGGTRAESNQRSSGARSRARAASEPKTNDSATARARKPRTSTPARPKTRQTAARAARSGGAAASKERKPSRTSKVAKTKVGGSTRTREPRRTTEPSSRRPPASIDQQEDPAAVAAARHAQLDGLGLIDGEPAAVRMTGSIPPGVGSEGPTVTAAPGMQICSECGLALWAGARFCRRCGQGLAADDDAAIQPTEIGAEPFRIPRPAAVRPGLQPPPAEPSPDRSEHDSHSGRGSNRGAA